MAFTLIRGTYHIQGYEPDGDSIRFAALDVANWDKLSGRVDVNARGHAQLRLDGIDTLETHFSSQHQPLQLALEALRFLLQTLNVTNVTIDPSMQSVTAADDGTPGYIVSRAAEKYGRPVAFAFPGTPSEPDGSSLFLTAERLRQSVNHKSVLAGLAYPTYYTSLFPDLRSELTHAAATPRAAKQGVWSGDVTNAGFDVPNLAAITDRHVILPKLFRRLVEFLRGGGSVAGFKEFMRRKAEPITIINTTHFTHFDTILEVHGGKVKMTQRPENVVFNE